MDGEFLDRYAGVYETKYDSRPDMLEARVVTFALIPLVAFAWLERSFPEPATRWTFQ